jgi:mono/diheme cytochrome c family protein
MFTIMRTKVFAIISVSAAIIISYASGLFATQSYSRRSVWQGVYSQAQAARGKEEYQQTCARCHAANLDGVQDASILGDFAPRFSIRGTDFMERWREDTGYSLFTFIKMGMPPRTEPKPPKIPEYSDEQVLDLMAYIFQQNGFPAGNSDMSVAELRGIRIQEQNGSKPLPSFSVVQAVGCLKQLTPGAWELAASPEPQRIRQLTKPSDEDLQAGANEPLGNIEFDLQNIGYLGHEFDPVEYEGHKMMVRGILIRQPPNVRIDVREMVEVGATCEP